MKAVLIFFKIAIFVNQSAIAMDKFVKAAAGTVVTVTRNVVKNAVQAASRERPEVVTKQLSDMERKVSQNLAETANLINNEVLGLQNVQTFGPRDLSDLDARIRAFERSFAPSALSDEEEKPLGRFRRSTSYMDRERIASATDRYQPIGQQTAGEHAGRKPRKDEEFSRKKARDFAQLMRRPPLDASGNDFLATYVEHLIETSGREGRFLSLRKSLFGGALETVSQATDLETKLYLQR